MREKVIQQNCAKPSIYITDYCDLQFYNFSRCRIFKFIIYNAENKVIVNSHKNVRTILVQFINSVDIDEFKKYTEFPIKYELAISENNRKLYSYIEKYDFFLSYKNNNFTINEIARLCEIFGFTFEFQIMLTCDKNTDMVYFRN